LEFVYLERRVVVAAQAADTLIPPAPPQQMEDQAPAAGTFALRGRNGGRASIFAQIASVEGIVKGRSREAIAAAGSAGAEYKLKVTWEGWSPRTVSCISLSDVKRVRGALPPDLCRMVSDRIEAEAMSKQSGVGSSTQRSQAAAAAWWDTHPDNPTARTRAGVAD
jgi:hypothetical protein